MSTTKSISSRYAQRNTNQCPRCSRRSRCMLSRRRWRPAAVCRKNMYESVAHDSTQSTQIVVMCSQWCLLMMVGDMRRLSSSFKRMITCIVWPRYSLAVLHSDEYNAETSTSLVSTQYQSDSNRRPAPIGPSSTTECSCPGVACSRVRDSTSGQ